MAQPIQAGVPNLSLYDLPERYEHCMVEWYWTVPNGADPVLFKPSFTVFHADGQRENSDGGSTELTALFNKMGQTGWRIASAITASNWILWTLERRTPEPSP